MEHIPDYLRQLLVLSTAARIKEVVGEDIPAELGGQAALLVAAGAAVSTRISREEFAAVAAEAYETVAAAAAVACDCSDCDAVDCPDRIGRTGTDDN